MKTQLALVLFFAIAFASRGADDSDFRRQIQSTTFTRSLLTATNAAEARSILDVSGTNETAIAFSELASREASQGEIAFVRAGSELRKFYGTNSLPATGTNRANVSASSNPAKWWVAEDINVRPQKAVWWGMVGDGTTDNSAAFADLLAFSRDIQISRGRYAFASPVAITNAESIAITSPDGSYQGGYHSTNLVTECEFVYTGPATNIFFDFEPTPPGTLRYGNRVENITFNANGLADTSVRIGHMGRARFVGCRFLGGTGVNWLVNASQFCTFIDCSTSINDETPTPTVRATYGMSLTNFSPANVFIDCQWENSSGTAVLLAGNAKNNSFVGGAIEANDGDGLVLESGATGNTFSGTWFEANGGTNSLWVKSGAIQNTFSGLRMYEDAGAVRVSGSYNSFRNFGASTIWIEPAGTRNKWENMLWVTNLVDQTAGGQLFMDMINAPATIRSNTWSSPIVQYGEPFKLWNGTNIHERASLQFGGVFFGDGSNPPDAGWSRLSASSLATSNTVVFLPQGVNDTLISAYAPGDAQPRVRLSVGQSLAFGPGGSDAPDVILRRLSAGNFVADDTAVLALRTNVNALGFGAGMTNDTATRIAMTAGGRLLFGDGASAQTASISFDSAGTIRVTTNLVVDGSITLGGVTHSSWPVGGGVGDVTLDGTNAFTGENSFSGLTTISNLSVPGVLSVGSITSGAAIGMAIGGTGGTNAESARASLGVTYDTDVQAYRLGLLQAALALTADGHMVYHNGTLVTNLASTAAGRALLTAASASAQWNNYLLAVASTNGGYDSASWNGISDRLVTLDQFRDAINALPGGSNAITSVTSPLSLSNGVLSIDTTGLGGGGGSGFTYLLTNVGGAFQDRASGTNWTIISTTISSNNVPTATGKFIEGGFSAMVTNGSGTSATWNYDVSVNGTVVFRDSTGFTHNNNTVRTLNGNFVLVRESATTATFAQVGVNASSAASQTGLGDVSANTAAFSVLATNIPVTWSSNVSLSLVVNSDTTVTTNTAYGLRVGNAWMRVDASATSGGSITADGVTVTNIVSSSSVTNTVAGGQTTLAVIGAGVTGINADNIATGTLASNRLPAAISLTTLWAGTLTATSVSGDGSGLTNLQTAVTSPTGNEVVSASVLNEAIAAISGGVLFGTTNASGVNTNYLAFSEALPADWSQAYSSLAVGETLIGARQITNQQTRISKGQYVYTVYLTATGTGGPTLKYRSDLYKLTATNDTLLDTGTSVTLTLGGVTNECRTVAFLPTNITLAAGEYLGVKRYVTRSGGASANVTVLGGTATPTHLDLPSASITSDYVSKAGDTMTGDLSVPDEAYGAGWDGSVEVPTKNAVYDKIQTLSGGTVYANGTGITGLNIKSGDYSTVTIDTVTNLTVQPTRVPVSAITFASTNSIDMSVSAKFTLSVTNDTTFASGTISNGVSVLVLLTADSSARNLTWPAGWTFLNVPAPTQLAASKTAILALETFGTTATNVYASYSAQP